jgi:hypothetical protein
VVGDGVAFEGAAVGASVGESVDATGERVGLFTGASVGGSVGSTGERVGLFTGASVGGSVVIGGVIVGAIEGSDDCANTDVGLERAINRQSATTWRCRIFKAIIFLTLPSSRQ